ncbi:PLP-dependent aminotransferase family protein [Pseudomonas sp. SLFW]|uniref:MocR-like pyridoxine biosynthesis transcription factor PdxR n=1 Tax=Pseudomonas sp. SLFW TaxID=2683259 RepID=UPI001412E25A|nr:aminotransferase class I/II-fold pyridoxal phosphate-dependent enzyme [Pseudomonas sp. SLFW]
MELHVVIQGRKKLSEQLYEQLKNAIENGRLAPGSQLPPSRLLAQQLNISRKTVSDTYTQLTYESYVTGVVGKGTFVSASPCKRPNPLIATQLASATIIERWERIPAPPSDHSLVGTPDINFVGGATHIGAFPQDEWRRCVNYALRRIQTTAGSYNRPEGIPPLRHAIAQYIAFSRGLTCLLSDIVVCNGTQQALDLIARVVLEPGIVVAVEDPGYPPARRLFASHGAKVVGVPVDDEGIRADLIPDGTQLIYVTPAHQFPLGMPMSMARRRALIERARELGALIIEDDYDSEFRYEGRPTDSLKTMDEYGLVAFVGTFSKTMLPELRIGYAVLPPSIIGAVIKAKLISDWHTSTIPQWALTRFIADGGLLKHVRRCHAIYANRRQRILNRLENDLAPWLDVIPTTAGLHIAARFKTDVDVNYLIERAFQSGIGLYSIERYYYQTEPQPGLLLGFGAIETMDIDPAFDRLQELLQTPFHQSQDKLRENPSLPTYKS